MNIKIFVVILGFLFAYNVQASIANEILSVLAGLGLDAAVESKLKCLIEKDVDDTRFLSF